MEKWKDANKSVVAHVRTTKDALGKRYEPEVDTRSPTLRLPVRRAASLATRCQVGGDGRTAYDRRKGKQHKKELAEFGECTL